MGGPDCLGVSLRQFFFFSSSLTGAVYDNEAQYRSTLGTVYANHTRANLGDQLMPERRFSEPNVCKDFLISRYRLSPQGASDVEGELEPPTKPRRTLEGSIF